MIDEKTVSYLEKAMTHQVPAGWIGDLKKKVFSDRVSFSTASEGDEKHRIMTSIEGDESRLIVRSSFVWDGKVVFGKSKAVSDASAAKNALAAMVRAIRKFMEDNDFAMKGKEITKLKPRRIDEIGLEEKTAAATYLAFIDVGLPTSETENILVKNKGKWPRAVSQMHENAARYFASPHDSDKFKDSVKSWLEMLMRGDREALQMWADAKKKMRMP